MMVELVLAVGASDDDVEELHSLFEALVEDDELRPARKSIERSATRTGTLGAEETIRIVVDSAALCTALSTCVVAWLRMRRPKLRLTVTGADGASAEIDATGARAVDQVHVREVIELVRRSGPVERGAVDDAS
ncbi:effector-associated constant component EACC1 [Nocardia niigatensis]